MKLAFDSLDEKSENSLFRVADVLLQGLFLKLNGDLLQVLIVKQVRYFSIAKEAADVFQKRILWVTNIRLSART